MLALQRLSQYDLQLTFVTGEETAFIFAQPLAALLAIVIASLATRRFWVEAAFMRFRPLDIEHWRHTFFYALVKTRREIWFIYLVFRNGSKSKRVRLFYVWRTKGLGEKKNQKGWCGISWLKIFLVWVRHAPLIKLVYLCFDSLRLVAGLSHQMSKCEGNTKKMIRVAALIGHAYTSSSSKNPSSEEKDFLLWGLALAQPLRSFFSKIQVPTKSHMLSACI